VAELAREHPDLADAFSVLRNKMASKSDTLSVRQNSLTLPREGNRLERERDTAKYEEILREIRSKTGFTLPPTPEPGLWTPASRSRGTNRLYKYF
jgi:hypothetical protein